MPMITGGRMPNWQLNPALTRYRSAVNARYGARRDMESDGTIGDQVHAARSSDHNPDDDGSVDAWDMDVDVNGRGQPYKDDVEALKRVFEQHESSSYWIHNDRIARRSNGWKRESYAYAGPSRNRHEKHVHWNTRQSHENSTKPWVLADSLEVPEMTMTPQQAQQLRDAHYTTAVAIPNPTGDGKVPLHVWAGWMTVAVKTLLAKDDVELDADELAQIQAAARAGAAESAEAVVAGVLAGLPEGTLTKDDVAAAVRQVLLTGAGQQA